MKLFVVKALASGLVGGGDGFVCRGVVRLFCFLRGALLFVSIVFVWCGRATLMPSLVLLAALMMRCFLRFCGVGRLVCLTATRSFGRRLFV